jgi:hypothetical protein
MVYFLLLCQFLLNMHTISISFSEIFHSCHNEVKGEFRLFVVGASLYDGPPAFFSQSGKVMTGVGSRGFALSGPACF